MEQEWGFRFGEFTVDPTDERLIGPQGPVRLGNKAFRVLLRLLENEGRLLSKDELFSSVWDGTTVSESALTSVIKELRRALGDESREPRFIASVYGRGYRFVGAADRIELRRRQPRRPAAAAPAEASVAVLAFANLTGDSALDYVSDGIAEEIITTLSRFEGLKVPARTSTFAYKGRDVDAREIARDLGVATVLEGSVRTAPGRVRVTAQLIEAERGFHVWAEKFDRPLDDLLALQDEIAAAVGRALRARIAAPRRQPDKQAFALYLQARGLAGRATADALRKAVELHERSIAIDPLFARAWSGLAGTLMVATSFGILPLERRSEARAKVKEAIRLDGRLAAPHAILAALDAAAGNWLDADAGFETAVELAGNDPAVLEAMGLQLLAPCGLLHRGLELCRDAVELAPAAANSWLSCAILSLLCGNVPAAAEELTTAELLGVSRERASYKLLRAELANVDGRGEEAGQLMAEALAGAQPLASAGIVRTTKLVHDAMAGRASRDEASAEIGRFVEATDCDEALWRYQGAAGRLMHWQVSLGSVDGAYAIADRLIGSWQRCGHLATTSLIQMWRRDMEPFRHDARFQALVERLGMVRFWERVGPPDGLRGEHGRLVNLDGRPSRRSSARLASAAAERQPHSRA